ncbi:MAG TPA: DUF2059 domain-containing protein [Methylovirgula sp.]
MSLKFESRLRGPLAPCLAAAVLLCLAPAAQAQKPDQPAAPATTAPAATAAPATTPAAPAAAEPSASQLAAARQLVVVSGMSRSFDATIPQMLNRLTTGIAQTQPLIAPDLAAVLKQLRPEFANDVDQMIDRAAHIYASLLTETEIKAAVAFFTSDAGKSYVHAEPIFFNKVINAMQDWHDHISAKMMARVREEMKKKGHTL